MPDPRPKTRTQRLTDLAVLALFLCLVIWKLAPAWEQDPGRAVPTQAIEIGQPLAQSQEALRRADLTFYTWLTARNARVLTTSPMSLFEAENCAPTAHSLALSAPGVTLGLYGIPALAISGNPILTYNFVVAAMLLFAAFALYLLIVEWTGSVAAGITAGILYGLHAVRLDLLLWVAEVDTTWTILALLLARRLFARGRNRDAVLLAAVCCLQMVTSFYSFLASALLGVCFGVWLLKTYGLKNVQARQLAALAAFLGLFATLFFAPYFELRDAGELFQRDFQVPMPLSAYLPGQPHFLGLTLWILVGVALIRGKKGLRASLQGDPRGVLALSAGITTLVAAGWSLNYQFKAIWEDAPFSLPDFFQLLAALVPGLQNIRVISLIAAGVDAAACILAGIGAAALIHQAGRWKNVAGVAIVAFALLDIMGPRLPGFTASGRVEGIDIHPEHERIAFSEELGRLASPGPIFELPFDHGGGTSVAFGPERVLLSFYHRRKTSACYSAFPPRSRETLADSVRPPLDREGIQQLQRMGFETLVLHGPNRPGNVYAADLKRLANEPAPLIEALLDSSHRVAYSIVARPEPGNMSNPVR